jgi:hypothetical protein
MLKKLNKPKKNRILPCQLFDSKEDLPFISNCPKVGQQKLVTAIKKSPVNNPWQPPDDLVEFFHEKFPQCDRTAILEQLQFEAEIVRNEILNDPISRKGLSTFSAQVGDSVESPNSLPVRVSRSKSKYPLRMKRLPKDVSPSAQGFCPLEPVSEGLFLNYWVVPD